MTIIEHLTELRRRLMISLVAVAVGGIVAFVLYERILDLLLDPYCEVAEGQCRLLATSPLDPFAVRLQIATYSGLLFATPVVTWQIWRFVAPGLYSKEKRYAIPFIASTVVLFAFGAFVAYVTFPRALDFLLNIGGSSLDVRLNPTKYLGLITVLMLVFGVSFEFPVLLVFLQLVGVLSSARLRAWRRWAIVLVFVFAALITPSQDPYSLLGMALPMCVFYEAAILIGRALKR